jgi:hypothetical protein
VWCVLLAVTPHPHTLHTMYMQTVSRRQPTLPYNSVKIQCMLLERTCEHMHTIKCVAIETLEQV